jgi:polyisoprenoid-binding protein YceI
MEAEVSPVTNERDIRRLASACALIALAATLAPHGANAFAAGSITPVATEVPAGTYRLDPAHASLIFRVSHLGFSRYTARFTRFDAELRLDPADPASATVTATIDPSSIETDNPDPSYDFDAQLRGEPWLDTVRFPQMTFRSTEVELTAPDSARITGDLELHGITRSVTLEATFNGGYASHALDPFGARIGFSAEGTLMRSAFGIAEGLPPPGSDFGVGDAVEILLEAEFTRATGEARAE